MDERNAIEKIRFKENNFTWVSINQLDERAIRYLKRSYKFHHLDLEDCLSEFDQRPKIDEYEDYLFIILHAPYRIGGKKRLLISGIYIFISQHFVITLHDNNPIINDIFEKCQKKKKIKDQYMSKGTGYFLYMIVDDLFESNFPIIDDLGKQLNDLEKEVFDEEHSSDKLKEILLFKKDIINFRRIIMPQRPIVAQLEHKNKKFLPDNLDIYFDDIVDKVEKIWNNLENLQELVTSLQETNESIISHNTNNVIKILTLFSVIMLLLTFITGLYGMNIATLPFAGSAYSFKIIAGIISAVVVGTVGYFKYKKWL